MKNLALTTLLLIITLFAFAQVVTNGDKRSQIRTAVRNQSVVYPEDIVTIQSIPSDNLWEIVRTVLKEKKTTEAIFQPDENWLISNYIEWSTLTVPNRGQLEFLYNSTTLTIRFANHMYYSSSGWTQAVGSLSKKNHELYLQKTADRILELSKNGLMEKQVPSEKGKSSRPFYDSTFFLKATNFFKIRDYDNAISSFTKAILIDQEFLKSWDKVRNLVDLRGNPEIYVWRGKCYTMKMISLLNKIKEKNETNTDILIIKSMQDTALIFKTIAIDDFNTAIDIDIKYSKAYYNKGLINYYYYEDHGESHMDFFRAKDYNPNDAMTNYYLGMTTSDPVLYFNQCIIYSNDSVIISECRKQIGLVLVKDRQYANAIKEFDNSISFDNTQWEAYLQRGNSKSILKDFDGAISDFTWLINNYPNYTLPYVKRGKAYMLKTGNLQQACPDFKKAIELGATSDEAKENYQLCK